MILSILLNTESHFSSRHLLHESFFKFWRAPSLLKVLWGKNSNLHVKENFKNVKNVSCLRLNFWLPNFTHHRESIFQISNMHSSTKKSKNLKSLLCMSIRTGESRLPISSSLRTSVDCSSKVINKYFCFSIRPTCQLKLRIFNCIQFFCSSKVKYYSK
jgi:hypothetical protein